MRSAVSDVLFLWLFCFFLSPVVVFHMMFKSSRSSSDEGARRGSGLKGLRKAFSPFRSWTSAGFLEFTRALLVSSLLMPCDPVAKPAGASSSTLRSEQPTPYETRTRRFRERGRAAPLVEPKMKF